MADVKLSRPAQGQHIVVPSTPDARMILDFSADQVNIDRPEGSNSLFFQFGDGASIELQNFYTAYNKEEMPEFQIDGQIIAGTDFFQAFGPDLLPAAGPAASAERGARYSEYANMNLAEGTWHLNELDYRLAFDGRQSTDEWQHGVIDNLAPTFSTGGAPITLGLTETGWDGKSPASPAPSVTGSFTVQDPDGDSLTATVAIGGKTVVVSLAGPTTVESDYGSLVITPKGGGSNVTFNFEYTLKEEPYSKTDQLAQGEQVTDGIVITVNDGMGHTVTQPINVVITGSNDAPDITHVDDLTLKDQGVFAGEYGTDDRTEKLLSDENYPTQNGGTGAGQHQLTADGKIVAADPDHGDKLTYGFASVTINGATNSLTADADQKPATGFDTVYTVKGYGTLHLNSETGQYHFVLDDQKNSEVDKLAEGKPVTISFTPSVTDMHGALSFQDGAPGTMRDGTPTPGGGTVDITIIGSNERPYFAKAPVTWANNDNTVTEDDSQHNTVSGQIHGEDVDTGDNLVYGFVHKGTEGALSNDTRVDDLYVVHSGSDSRGYTLETSPPLDRNYYGKITITNANTGEFKFELNNGAPCTQALDDNSPSEGLNVTVPVVVQDVHGAWSVTSIAIRIDGANDAPQFTMVESGGVKESGFFYAGSRGNELNALENTNPAAHALTLTGTVTASDVDTGDMAHLTFGLVQKDGSASVTGTVYVTSINADGSFAFATEPPAANAYFGTLRMDTVSDGAGGMKGQYTFALNDAKDSPANKLGENESVFLKVYPTVSDALNNSDANAKSVISGTPITITIHGSNDAPLVDANNTNTTLAVHEQGAADPNANGVVSGSFVVTDVDSKDTITFGLVHQDGKTVSWSESSAPGTLYVIMGSGENAGKLVVTGVAPSSATYDNYYGMITIHPDATDATGKTASYTFTLFNGSHAVDSMAEGPPQNLSFTLVAGDDKGAYATQNVSLTIHGANDTPVITPVTGEVTEAGVSGGGNTPFAGLPSISGTLKATDVDADQKETDGSYKAFTFDIQGGKISKGTFSVSEPNETFDVKCVKPEGTLYLDSKTGSYRFELDNTNTNVQNLAQGKTHDIAFTYTAKDIHDASSTAQDIKITIVGSNDQPTLSLNHLKHYNSAGGHFEVTEGLNNKVNGTGGAAVYTLGKAVADDVDDGHKLQFGLAYGTVSETQGTAPAELAGQISYTANTSGVITMKGNYGTLRLNTSTGAFSYSVDNAIDSKANKLAAGEYGSDTFTVMVKDEHGAWTTKPVTIEVTGVNDPPYLKGGNTLTGLREAGIKNGGNVDEAGVEVKTGKLEVADPDSDLAENPYSITGGTPESGGVWMSKETTYGTLRLNTSTGEYEYRLRNDDKETQALHAGEKVTDSIAITVTDERGAVLSTSITVKITGTNDKPMLNLGKTNLTVTEDDAAAKVDAGVATWIDDDSGDSPSYHLVVDGHIGKYYDAATGQTKAVSSPTVNDTASSIKGTYGTLTIDSDSGEYTYKLANDSEVVQNLTSSDHPTETFYVMVKDKYGAFDIKPVTVTVNGTDDAIVLSSTDVHTAQTTESGVAFNDPTENVSSVDATGTIKVNFAADGNEGGADRIQFGFKVTDAKGQETYYRPSGDEQGYTLTFAYGTLSIDKGGKYTFSLNNDNASVNALNAGEKKLLTELLGGGKSKIEIAVWDKGHADASCATQELELTINGTNDNPYFTANMDMDKDGVIVSSDTKPTGGPLTEESAKYTQLEGTLTGDDPDTPGNVKFTLVTTNKAGTVTGLTQVIEGKYGFLHLKEDGAYTYTLTKPEDLQELNNGALSKDETFTVRVLDPLGAYAEKKLVIEIAGAEDKPIISHTDLTVKEAGFETPGTATAKGSIAIKAIDAADIPLEKDPDVIYSYKQPTIYGTYGKLNLAADGSYTYELNNGNPDIDALNVGQSKSESFTFEVTATKGTATVTEMVTVNVGIQGTNDAPTLSGTAVEKGVAWKGVFFDVDGTSAHTFGSVVATGQVDGAADVDNAVAELSYMIWNGSSTVSTFQTNYGTISMNADGSYSYYLDTYSGKLATDLAAAKAAGTTLKDTFAYKAVDPHGAYSAASKTIEIVISDVIPGFDVSTVGSYGFNKDESELAKKIIEDNGEVAKTPGGEVPAATLSVSGQLEGTWTLLGVMEWESNHGFGIKSAQGNQVQSSAGTGVAGAGKYGYIVIDPMTGKYTYTLFNDSTEVQALNKGESREDTFTLMRNGAVVQDGGKDVVITITIQGTNDVPVITQATGATIEEDAANTAGRFAAAVTGILAATDVDAGATLTWKVIRDPLWGAVDISQKDGQWTYTYKPKPQASGAPADLQSGESKHDTFTVQVSDGEGDVTTKEIVITYEGKNNVPTGSDNASLLVIKEDDGPEPGTNLRTDLNVQDDRSTSDLSFSVSAEKGDAGGMVARGTYGTLYLDGKGGYTYALNNADSKVQALHEGKTVDDIFYVTIKDSEGGSSAPISVTVQVTGTNDAPQLSLEKVLLVREDTTVSDSGKALWMDKDAGETLTITVTTPNNAVGESIVVLEEGVSKTETEALSIDGRYGTLTFKADGTYTYNLTSHALGAGEKGEDVFTIEVVDKFGVAGMSPASQTLKVSIIGANDTPTITVSDSTNEGGNLVCADPDTKDTLSLSVWYKHAGAANETEYKVTPMEGTDAATRGEATITGVGTFNFTRVNANSPWESYTFSADDALAAAIRVGVYGDEITVRMEVSDQHNAANDASVTVKALGTNAAPVAVDVDNGLLFGHVSATNKESFDTLTFQADKSGSHHGDMQMSTDGNYEYALGTTESDLGALQKAYDDSFDGHVYDHFAFSVTDGHEISGESSHLGRLSIDLYSGAKLDASGGQLLFAQENSTTHNYEAAGGAGNDILIGGSNDDFLYGGAGDDYLFGGDGNDFLDGGTSNYNAATGEGGNHLYGGAGNDVLVFHSGDTIDGGAGTDVLVIRGGSVDDLFKTDLAGKSDMDNVSNMEILVSSNGTTLNNLTSMSEIAEKIGMKVNSDGTLNTAELETPTEVHHGSDVWNVYTLPVHDATTDQETVKIAILQASHG